MAAAGLAPAALEYATTGWAVFPVAAGDKHPLISKGAGGHGCHDATRDSSIIKAWWQRWPEANIGLATGSINDIVVLDVDPRNGGDAALADLERRFGLLPQTAISHTGSGGRHVLFRHVPGVRGGSHRLGPGLDIKSEGGYIVAPPSVHPSGRRYAWQVDAQLGSVEIAMAPAWLKPALVTAPQPPRLGPKVSRCVIGLGRARLAALARTVVRATEGSRNCVLFWAACRVAEMVAQNQLAGAFAMQVLVIAAQRAGLPEHEASRTVESAFRTNQVIA